MKIQRKDIGVKEVSKDMKNAAIARKKALAKKKIPKVKKVVAKPATKTAKAVAAVKKVLTRKIKGQEEDFIWIDEEPEKKGKKRGKKNRSKNL